MEYDINRLRNIVSRCTWSFAKSMPTIPHEYIVRGKCALSEEEFLYFVDMQRKYGTPQRWGKYNHPYLHIDGYKYWTMGASYEETIIINRAKEDCNCDEIFDFYHGMKECVRRMPSRFNALEYVTLDENANSRILRGILSHHKKLDFFVLKDFVARFVSADVAKLIDTPEFVTEQVVTDDKRIDLYIYEEGKYAIIFENKFNEAPEQPNQLANYIEGVDELGFSAENTYIIYLPWSNCSGPSEISWTSKTGYSYEEDFKDRFSIVSFKEELLTWLKSEDFPKVEDPLFVQSVKMYIDFIESKIQRKGATDMTQEEKLKYIANRLQFTGDPQQDSITIFEKIREVESLKNDLATMKKKQTAMLMQSWEEQIKVDFPSFDVSPYTIEKKIEYVGIQLPFKDIPNAVQVRIWINDTSVSIFVSTYGHTDLSATIFDLLSGYVSTQKGFRKGNEWIYYKNVSIATAYEEFTNFTVAVMEAIGLPRE